MTARLPFVDAHVHWWDRAQLRYPWLDEPSHRAIGSDYRAADYLAEATGWNVVGCVHVDAGAHPDDGRAETAWLETQMGQRAPDLPSAIVARVALDRPDVEAELGWHASRARVRGIRHLINWHPDDPARRAYPRDLTLDPAWRRGFAQLAHHRLRFEFHGFPPQLAGMVALARAHPQVPVILDHLGLPILADGLQAWRAGLTAFAELPQTAIKLSGAGFIASPFAPAAFAAIVCEVIDLFGPKRVMVATNFPTDRLFASLDATLSAYEAILAPFSEDERRDLWGRNADRIYDLGLAL